MASDPFQHLCRVLSSDGPFRLCAVDLSSSFVAGWVVPQDALFAADNLAIL